MTNQHKYTPLIDGIENGRLNLRDVQKILEEWREEERIDSKTEDSMHSETKANQKQPDTDAIQQARDEERARILKVANQIGECLEYCAVQNGMPYCKNCGLSLEMYKALINNKENHE